MRNPVDYRRISSAADIRRIFASLRKRVQAAYAAHRAHIIRECSMDVIQRRVPRNVDYELKSWDDRTAMARDRLAQKEEAALRHHVASRSQEHASMVPLKVRDGIKIVREYEADAFQSARAQKHLASLRKRGAAETKPTEEWQAFLTRVRRAFPYAAKEYPERLLAAVTEYGRRLRKVGRSPLEVALHIEGADFNSLYLQAAGIPASTIAGPWVTPGRRPQEWLSSTGEGHRYMSATVTDWLHDIGLDGDDRELSRRIMNYAIENKRVPSKQTAREINNQIEHERQQKEIEENIDAVRSWLNCSAHWRRGNDVSIPPLLDAWRVVTPRDAEDLCRRAQKDGLCVVDVLSHIMNDADEGDEAEDPVFEKSKKEGVCTLLFSIDPKRKTIVGLDEDGVCTSHHHCTGRDNKLDPEAWEYFKR